MKIKSFHKAVFFVLIAFLALNFLTPKKPHDEKLIKPLAVSANKPIPSFTLKPTSTPTPTPTPTPSPVPLGYCLRVPVLFYHHIQPQAEAAAKHQTSVSIDNGFFEQQMAYLNSAGYTTIFANDLISALKTHTGVPPKSVLVTIDDGYSDLYAYAFPIIKRYNIKTNLMIATGLVNNPEQVSWDQLREIKGSGLAYFVDHTWSHTAVNSGTLEKIKYEIETGKSQLEQNIGQTVNIFAYPYGSFSQTSINVLIQDGFSGAFATTPGFYQCDSFIYTLHRRPIGNAPLSAYGL